MSKKIALDLSPAEASPAGIGHYTVNLTRKLIELDRENEYYIYTTKPFPRLEYDEKRVFNVVIPFPQKYRARGIRWMLDVGKDLKAKKIDLLISYSYHFFSLAFPKTIQFIHDLSPIKFPQYHPVKSRMVYPFTAKMAFQKAMKIVTISKTVRNELQAFSKMPEAKIDVIYPARNEYEKYEKQGEKPELPKDYILSVCTLEPRKNLTAGIKAFAKLKTENRLKKGLKYVIVGKKGWYFDEIFKLVEALNLKEDIIFTGYVSDYWVPDIFKKAKAFLFLSHYEGFGMPPLEALYYGIPLLLNDIPVFRECFGPWARFADASSPDISDLAEELYITLNDKPLATAESMSEAATSKFNWTISAKKLLNLIS